MDILKKHPRISKYCPKLIIFEQKYYTMKAKISIITVVRNAPQALELTLNALKRLTYPNTELIVIDGNSTDSTPEIIARHSDALGYWVSEPDRGLYDAMNKGIRAATGDYLWFINAGDLPYDEGVLDRVFSEAKEPLADVYFGEAMITSENGEVLGLRKKKLPRSLSWRSLWKGMVVCHQGFIAKKEIAPLYDTSYRFAADIDWVIEILKRSKNICNTGEILCKFAEGGISTINRKASLKERFTIMRKHYKLFPTLLYHIYIFASAPLSRKYRKIK